MNPPDGVAEELPEEANPGSTLRQLQLDWEASTNRSVEAWKDFLQTIRAAILLQVEGIAATGSLLELLNILNPAPEAMAASAAMIEAEMMSLGQSAANDVVTEAKAQGLTESDIIPVGPDRTSVAVAAQLGVGIMTRVILGSATSETFRVWNRSRSAVDVRDDVGAHLESLTDAHAELVISSLMSSAQRDGRVRTMQSGPVAALYADEVLDKNTCSECRKINRKWIGNSDDPFPPLTYPVAGYVNCLGRWRCRGQVVAVWRGGDDWKKWVELPAQR